MEEEAMFLFVIYRETELEPLFDEKTRIETRNRIVDIKRAARQKVPREGYKAKRIHIDFDPMDKRLCYLVVCFFKRVEHDIVSRNIPHFIGIFENQTSAQIIKNNIENGDHKYYSDKAQIFESASIITLDITRE